MGINFTDLDRKALAVFGYSSTDPVFPASVRAEQANYALWDLADMADWPCWQSQRLQRSRSL